MNPEGRDANRIVANELIDHSSWHFFQAVSWLDLAKRTQKPSVLHHAAFELRYGVEYLLFELLVLISHGLTEKQYQACLGDPKGMKRELRSSILNYDRLVEFTRILMSLDPKAPTLRYWRLDDLFRYWGIASEFLHFMGAHSLTYGDEKWFICALSRLEDPIREVWRASTETLGYGLFAIDKMVPEVRKAWDEFLAGSLCADDLKIRMSLAHPILRHRHQNRPNK